MAVVKPKARIARRRPERGPFTLAADARNASRRFADAQRKRDLTLQRYKKGKTTKSALSRSLSQYFDSMFDHIMHELAVEKALVSDPKFKILNDRAFNDKLFPFLRTGLKQGKSGGFSYATIDANKFKLLNDKFGHGVGDRILDQLSTTFSAFAAMHGGLAARFGGDEFRIMIQMPADKFAEKLSAVQSEFIRSLAKPWELGVEPMNGWKGWKAPTFSAGIREMSFREVADFPKINEAVSRLAVDSDLAVYKAKKLKRQNHIHIFKKPRFSLISFLLGRTV